MLIVTDDRLPSESTRHLKLTQDHEDFELKKSLMSLLITLSNDSPAAVQVSQYYSLGGSVVSITLFQYR